MQHTMLRAGAAAVDFCNSLRRCFATQPKCAGADVHTQPHRALSYNTICLQEDSSGSGKVPLSFGA
jgi:hypothetical protein